MAPHKNKCKFITSLQYQDDSFCFMKIDLYQKGKININIDNNNQDLMIKQ